MIGRLVISKSRDEDKPDAGEIAAMYLLDAFWNKGCGRKMMDFALAELKRAGHEEVFHVPLYIASIRIFIEPPQTIPSSSAASVKSMSTKV